MDALMLMDVDYNSAIRINDDSATARISYRGRPEDGMLAWLDSKEIQLWWKADTAIIDPVEGGMYFLSWGESDQGVQHAIYGVVEKIDTSQNRISISKILYISPMGKMPHLHLDLSFSDMGDGYTELEIVHRHQYSGVLRAAYNEAVRKAWPVAFALFVEYIKRKKEQ
jgi:Activator of Hsp90 ATPase homolog 1-like protein